MSALARGPSEWGERLFVLRIWNVRGEVCGIVRNTSTGRAAAFASREGFFECMQILHDSSTPPDDTADQ